VHVLTKIFVVLVSLLAVLLVPLVVVYAYNENSYKTRFSEAELKTASAQEALKAAEARAGAEVAALQREIQDYRTQIGSLQQDKSSAEVALRAAQSELATSRAMQSSFGTNLEKITQTLEANHLLTESLVLEIRELRSNAVAIERQKVELDEMLREVTSQLEVAEQARRALAEELARVKEEHTKALAKISQYVAVHGEVDARIGAVRERGLIPDVTLNATVIRVERSSGQVLAEIDAGSKDGVKEGWMMTLANGGTFIGNLRIINVDINRATGVVTLEDAKSRGAVQVGHSARTVAGQP
jgi:cell shape-determining protein MreC